MVPNQHLAVEPTQFDHATQFNYGSEDPAARSAGALLGEGGSLVFGDAATPGNCWSCPQPGGGGLYR